jgi:hypothetical protein
MHGTHLLSVTSMLWCKVYHNQCAACCLVVLCAPPCMLFTATSAHVLVSPDPCSTKHLSCCRVVLCALLHMRCALLLADCAPHLLEQQTEGLPAQDKRLGLLPQRKVRVVSLSECVFRHPWYSSCRLVPPVAQAREPAAAQHAAVSGLRATGPRRTCTGHTTGTRSQAAGARGLLSGCVVRFPWNFVAWWHRPDLAFL